MRSAQIVASEIEKIGNPQAQRVVVSVANVERSEIGKAALVTCGEHAADNAWSLAYAAEPFHGAPILVQRIALAVVLHTSRQTLACASMFLLTRVVGRPLTRRSEPMTVSSGLGTRLVLR